MNIGDKVVCIGGKAGAFESEKVHFIYEQEIPSAGKTYVVTGIVPGYELATKVAATGLVLAGCRTIYVETGLEVGWDSRYFRRLEEIKEAAKILEMMKKTNDQPTSIG